MKVAAFLALGLATVAEAQTTPLVQQQCLTQTQINSLSTLEMATLSANATPVATAAVSAQQAALQQLLELYGLYNPTQIGRFNSNTNTGSCASRCVTGSSVVGRTSTLGSNVVGCVPSFTSNGVTYTYNNGGYTSSTTGAPQTTFTTFGEGCQCDTECVNRGDCCVDVRSVCGLLSGFNYRYQIIETIEVPIDIAVPYIMAVPKGFSAPEINAVGVPVGKPFPVPVNNPLTISVPRDVLYDIPVPVAKPVNVPISFNNPVPNPIYYRWPVGVPVIITLGNPKTVNNPVDQLVNVPREYEVIVPVPVGVPESFNVPVYIPIYTPLPNPVPVSVNVPVNRPEPVNVPYTMLLPLRTPGEEVEQYTDIPVPNPVPIYVNNPIPLDSIRNIQQDVNVPFDIPERIVSKNPVIIPFPDFFNVPLGIDTPQLVDVPYIVPNEVKVPVNFPVPVAVPVFINVPIRYTRNNPYLRVVNRPIEIIEYRTRIVPVEIERAVATVEVPVYLGYTNTGTVLEGVEGIPAGTVTSTETIISTPDLSGFTDRVNDEVVVETVTTATGTINNGMGGPCNTVQVFDDFACINNVWTWTRAAQTNTISIGAVCDAVQVFDNIACINNVWTVLTTSGVANSPEILQLV